MARGDEGASDQIEFGSQNEMNRISFSLPICLFSVTTFVVANANAQDLPPLGELDEPVETPAAAPAEPAPPTPLYERNAEESASSAEAESAAESAASEAEEESSEESSEETTADASAALEVGEDDEWKVTPGLNQEGSVGFQHMGAA